MGWTNWLEVYQDRQHKIRVIQSAANRLSRPRLVHSFAHWHREWDIAMKVSERSQFKDALSSEIAKRDEELFKANKELNALRAELKDALEAVQYGGGREAQLQRQLDAGLAAEREKRIEHTQHMAIYRLSKKELTLGWTTWLSHYLAHQHTQRLLAMAGFRLLKPKLVAAYDHWRRDWDESRQRTDRQKFVLEAKRRAELEAELQGTRAQTSQQLKMQSAAMEEAGLSIKQLQRQLADALHRLGMETESVLDMNKALQEAKDGRVKAESGVVALEKRLQETAEASAQQTAKLLSDQRTQLESAAAEVQRELEAQLAALRAKLAERPSSATASAPSAAPPMPKRKSSVKQPPEIKKATSTKRPKPSMLAALATSMGVRPNLLNDAVEAADTVGDGENEFAALMRERAAAFQKADLDFDGKLDFEEYKAMVKYRETKEYTDKQLQEKFDDLDADKSGKIEQHEFIQYSLRDAIRRSKGRAIDIFRVWDEDGSGYIDYEEFTKAMIALGFCCSKADVEKVFRALDEDGSGEIEYEELNKMLRSKGGMRHPSAAAPAAAPPKRGASTKSVATAKSGGRGSAK